MTLTKNVLTRIIKEELAKIVSEQRNPRQINEIGSGDPVLDVATIAMIIKSLGSTAAVTKFMAALNAAVGVGAGAAAAASEYKTSKQTFDGGDEETMQEAKNTLFRITADYQLCQKLTGLYDSNEACFQYKIKKIKTW